jgi:BASS family bile acid:Na+ symporter
MLETRFFSSILLPAVIALTIMGIGTSLSFSDFRNILRFPRGIGVGLLGQLILLPLLAILIAYIAPLPPELKVGIVLVAACPGGATANLIVHLFRGNVAMSLSFTIINSVLTIVSIPAWVYVGLYLFMGEGQGVSLPLREFVIDLILMTVLPCAIGIIINNRFPDFIRKARTKIDIILPIILAVAIVAAIFLEKKDDGVRLTADIFLRTLPWVFLLNVAGTLSAYLLAMLFRLGNRNRMTLSVEIGLHNTVLAIFIASAEFMLNNALMAIPAAVYAMFSFFTAMGWAAFVRRHAIKFAVKARKRLTKK